MGRLLPEIRIAVTDDGLDRELFDGSLRVREIWLPRHAQGLHCQALGGSPCPRLRTRRPSLGEKIAV